MTQPDAPYCPVCNQHLREPPSTRGRPTADLAYYDCHRCGRFGLTRTAEVNLRSWLAGAGGLQKIAILGHALRKMQATQEWPLIGSQVAKRLMETATLPTAQEQADGLIRWLGTNLSGPGELLTISFLEHGAIIGTQSVNGFIFVVKGLIDTGLLQGSLAGGGNASVTLTFPGWQRYEELRKGAPSGRRAFMAMQYGDARFSRIVDDFFRPAVAETGFELRRLDDEPRAGLIDDRLRVEIQSARFLIADLTHRNPGAYWEAGYAEGLGKPVIYTCEGSVFEKGGSHFDTNHHLHVLWGEDDLAAAVARLKATIRATIPEARRDDQ